MRFNKKKIGITLGVLLVLFVAALSTFYYFRDEILKLTLEKVAVKMERDFDSKFTIKTASFDGISAVSLTDVVLAPQQADTLFRIQKMKTSISFWHLLIGDVQLGTLEIQNGLVQLTKKGKVRNFDAFLKKNKNQEVSTDKRDYAALAKRIIFRLLNLVPSDMDIKNLVFKLDDNGKKATIDIKKLILDGGDLESVIHVKTNTFAQRWRIAGEADPRDRTADIQFFNMDGGPIKVPYFDERFNLISSFDSIHLNVENIESDGDEFHIDGYSSIANLKVNHPKIASKDVIIRNARFDYRLLLGEDFISVDSSSSIQLNKIKIQPYLAYETEEDTVYKMNIRIPKMQAQDFISSLPDGLFTNVQGMLTSGNFDYKLDFMFNKNKPETIIFDSKLNKENLRIFRFGQANLSKMNGEFEYRAIIKNVRQRPIFVGSSNPDYTPLNQISPYLKKCVLTTEDPSFFRHRGFITEAFKQSIIKNIKTRKFSRGGSTISMQLIKNVFLTREKTLSRKLEEILLVYILENNRIVSKERMLEVYFNIIEWGPNVYGIGEASRFYFQKNPADLTFNECLYLATIIPSPKKFMYQFDDQGNLKGFALKNQRYLSNLMLRRGIVTSSDSINPYGVSLSGNARSFLTIRKSQDTTGVAVDSIPPKEDFDFEFLKTDEE